VNMVTGLQVSQRAGSFFISSETTIFSGNRGSFKLFMDSTQREGKNVKLSLCLTN
jgi:hypothetical protein